ncbi:GAF and ANTAR domain-containing protein [Actinomadura kijaniata]|uniref:GAF and ANTAR domain-containing protein n=1 Tax=Actinomadura kijaniata TaxID=46161 RepID=UPI000A53EB8F|nr:GAF and ANTAR domain-containing protein [Actinomadura kijaniata]
MGAGRSGNEEILSSLRELTELLVSTEDVRQALQHIADIAAKTVPGGPAASVTLRTRHGPSTVAASGPLARTADLLQYELGHGSRREAEGGPCLASLHGQRRTVIQDIAADGRWRSFGERVLEMGVRSVGSYPLGVRRGVPGALNLYFPDPGGVNEGNEPVVEVIADHAALLLRGVLRHADRARTTEQLRDALASRAVIDQALGIIMAQRRIPAEEALALLRRASQRRNRKLRDIAAGIVEGVTGHRARPGPFQEGDPG